MTWNSRARQSLSSTSAACPCRWASSAASIPATKPPPIWWPPVGWEPSIPCARLVTIRSPATEAYIAGSGGMFRDFSVHDFDAIRFVTSEEVVEVYAQTTVRKWDVYERFDDADLAIATFTLSGGALGLMSYARHNPLGYDVRMELFGSRDSVVVGWDDRAPLRSLEPRSPPLAAKPYPDFHDRFADAYAAEIDAFLDVARGRQPSLSTADDAVEALRAAIACDISRRQHRPVALTEVP